MTAPVHTCHVEDSLERAAHLLWEHDCGCLPVVDTPGVVQAMITDRDICMAAYTGGRPLAELSVADSMSSDLVSCGPDDDLAAAAGRMAEHQFRRLPVLDGGGRVQGMLSLNDMACANSGDCTGPIPDPVATELLRALGAVSRHRSTSVSESAPEASVIPPSPARAPRSSKTAAKARKAERIRHEIAE